MFHACDPPAREARVTAGRYTVEALIGRGGSALVYRATDRHTGGTIALKLLRPEFASDAERIAELHDEATYMADLFHPHIVQFRETRMAEGGPFLAMELLPGPDLREQLRTGLILQAADAAALLAGIGDALFHIHQRGVVHADVKPGNLIRSRDGALKLIDFGSALRAGTRRPSGMRVVTPAYAAPELLYGEAADRRDDVYAFAVTAYELIADRHPFCRRAVQLDETPAPVPGLGREAWHWLRAALSYARAGRPTDPRDLAAAIRADRPLARFFGKRVACPA